MSSLIIPYRHDPNGVLQYTLKGVAMFMPVDDIKIIEGNDTGPKQLNIVNKIKQACLDSTVSDPFICMSDDVMLLKPWVHGNYHRGLIVHSRLGNKYEERGRMAIAQGCVFNHDNHAPWVVHKQKFLERFEGFTDGLIQSLYFKDEPGEYMPDIMVTDTMNYNTIREVVKDQARFSLYHNAWTKAVRKVLNEIYDSIS